MSTSPSRWIVTTAPGLESLLAQELSRLSLSELEESQGAVTFVGSWEDAARALTESRIGSRLYLSLKQFSAKHSSMLYDQVRRIDWRTWIQPGQTLAIFSAGKAPSPELKMSFAPLKIKDAICDELKKQGQDRPSIDRKNPHVRLAAFFSEGRCELSLDLCAAPLHHRGYRRDPGEAPLRENRAAALLEFLEVSDDRPLCDPFCGSGTLAIEAALRLLKIAPGLLRSPSAYAPLWSTLPEARRALEEARQNAQDSRLQKLSHPIVGSDFSKKQLREAVANGERAGLKTFIEWRPADARKLEAPDHWIVANPPYGVRLDEKETARQLLGDFTRQVKHHCSGSTLGLVLERGLEKSVGLRAARKLRFENGTLSGIFLQYNMVSGSFKPDRKSQL